MSLQCDQSDKCFISCWLNICERNKKCCSFHAKSFHYVMLGHAHKCACADVAVILLLLALLVGGKKFVLSSNCSGSWLLRDYHAES